MQAGAFWERLRSPSHRPRWPGRASRRRRMASLQLASARALLQAHALPARAPLPRSAPSASAGLWGGFARLGWGIDFNRLGRSRGRRELRPRPALLAAEQPSLAASEHDLLARDERHLDVRIDVPLFGIVDVAHPNVGFRRHHVAEQRQADDRPVAHRRILVAGVMQGLTARIVRLTQPDDLAADAVAAFLDFHLGRCRHPLPRCPKDLPRRLETEHRPQRGRRPKSPVPERMCDAS